MVRRILAKILGWWDGIRAGWKTWAAILFGLFVVFVWTPFFPHAAYNERLTITVMTPDGPVNGSSVTRVRHALSPMIGHAGGYTIDVAGEATVVDLGEGRYLFALLTSRGLAREAYEADGRVARFDRDRFRWNFIDLKYFSRHTPAPVPREAYPRLVFFSDIADPASVTLVDPDDLSASLGTGFEFEGMEVNLTWARRTKGGVDRVLGADFFRFWAMNHKAALKRGLSDPFFASLSSEMNRDQFIRGF